jgi:hypothetical protein
MDLNEKREIGYQFCEENLIECCEEMLEFAETGLLVNGKVWELINLFDFAGSSAMTMAENVIKTKAMERCVFLSKKEINKKVKKENTACLYGIVVSLTQDAYDYNDNYFTLEVSESGNTEECSADHSGLSINASKLDIATYLSGALKGAKLHLDQNKTIRDSASKAVECGLESVGKNYN